MRDKDKTKEQLTTELEAADTERKQVEEKDREIWAGENRIYLGEDNIIYITSVGMKDDKIAIAIKDAYIKMANMVEGKVDLLIDANKGGQPSSEARKIIQEGMLKIGKTGKVAIFGAHPVARVLASFVMGISKKKDIRFFSLKEEALAWLKE